MKKYFSVEIHPGSATNRPTEKKGLYFMPEPSQDYPVGPAPLTVRAKYWALSSGESFGGIKGRAVAFDEPVSGHEALMALQ